MSNDARDVMYGLLWVVAVPALMLLFIWITSGACRPGMTLQHFVPDEARPCQRECSLATARGGGVSESVAEKNYYRCLRTCPGVSTEMTCRGD